MEERSKVHPTFTVKFIACSENISDTTRVSFALDSESHVSTKQTLC